MSRGLKADEQNLLGLNIIVGAGESKELERCLKSVQGDLFDEIVVTVTHKEGEEVDPSVDAVAKKYATNVPYFQWCSDFSAARNYSFSHNTTKMILWLDADDVVKPSEYQKILQLKERLKTEEKDMILMDYVYSHDDKDQPQLVLPRERLVRNCAEIKWHDRIHEYLNMDASFRTERVPIKIDHYRTRPFNPERNLTLLKKSYEEDNPSPRTKFYYGKELCDVGRWDEAIPVLEEYVNKGDGFRDNLTVACIRLSKYYMDHNNPEAAKNFALKGVRFNSIYAENYVTLGIIYEQEGRPLVAAQYYKEALTKKLEGGMSQIVDYYGFIPAAKLAMLYMGRKEFKEALKYCQVALEHKPDHPQMMEIRKVLETEHSRQKKGFTLKETEVEEISNFLQSMSINMDVRENHNDYAEIRLIRQKKLEVAWLIPGLNLADPSTRIRRHNVSKKMNELGINSRLVDNYVGKHPFEVRNLVGDASVVIFSTFGVGEFAIMKHLQDNGIRCVLDHCEALFDLTDEDKFMKQVDLIACCSTKLLELTQKHGYMNSCVLRDAIEEREPSKPYVYEDRYEKPKALYMGMGGNSFLVTYYLREEIERAGYEIVCITEWDDADKKWSLETWPDDMVECDVVLCPQRVDVQPAKSSVKATAAMAFGMPVLASPIKAYTELIEHGRNGYICERKKDWYEALVALRDPKKREAVGKAGKESVQAYSLENIAKQWISTLTDLITAKPVVEEPPQEVEEEKSRDIVDIIIPNYNNVEYLKLCVSSILMNTLHPFHIVISDAGSDEETWKYLRTLKGISVLGDPGTRRTFSETCNAGIVASRTKYFVVLNSDTIVSKNWLTNLVNKMDTVGRLAACGVLSNCDRGWLHDNPKDPNTARYPMRLEKAGIELHPGMKLETMKPHLEELQEFMAVSNDTYADKYVPQKWVAAYATIFARSAINEVGLFDTQFKNGCEDLDLCIRLIKQGFACGQAIDSFIYHFGGVSRGAYERELDEEDKKCQDS